MPEEADTEEVESIFDVKGLDEIHQEIQEVYLRNDYPWVIGYSGGKDSTTTVQLIWYAISELPEEKRNKKVYVIAADTLVETPVIVDYIDDNIQMINDAAEEHNMPFEAHKVTPEIEETFWVKMIGKGYPAPSNRFRWCTDRMKIEPSNNFILNRVEEYGEVVVILGARKGESMTRDQVMNLHQIKGDRLKRHSELPRAYVYTPIEEFSLDDVWTYLLQVESPWGNENRKLASMYNTAQSDECPLVIDETTPSCGNSRFGCWTCTVVEEDKSMESMIDDGEEWMQPMFELRNKLKKTQDPEKKHKYRSYKRLDGTVLYKDNGEPSPGPYKLEFCKELLRDVLEAQEKVRENGPDPEEELIKEEELHEIRRIWRTERQDWEDSVPKIYEDVTGETLDWIEDDSEQFGVEEISLLHELAEERDVPEKLVGKLVEMERQMQGMSTRPNIFNRIDKILGEEWRPLEDVFAEHREQMEEAQ